MVKLLKDEKDIDIRRMIVVVLGELSDPAGINGLIGALTDKDETTQENAARSLIKIGNPSIEKLIAALDNKKNDPVVRQYAITILGKVSKKGDKKLIQIALAALTDKDNELRRRAAIVLGMIGDKNAVAGLIASLKDKSSPVQKNAAESLARIGKPAVKPLITALTDSNRDVRGYSVYALGRIGNKRCVRYLKMVANNDSDKMVQETAKNVLAKRKF
ncbi:HEAT repeat domain-containing protein [Candidatus Desantisbacteria bacterium]|nr:HEAT repeat domain-containing protein [Candidatus Desantisbacteria bacterium]